MPVIRDKEALRREALELGKQYQAAQKAYTAAEVGYANQVYVAGQSEQLPPPRSAALDAMGTTLSQLQGRASAADTAYSQATGVKSFTEAFGPDTQLVLGNVGGFGLKTSVTSNEYNGDTGTWDPVTKDVIWKYNPGTKTWSRPGTPRKVTAEEIGLGGYSGGDLTAALVPMATRAGQNTDEWSVERMSRLPSGSPDSAAITEIYSALPEWKQANKPQKDWLDQVYGVLDVVAPVIVGGMLTGGFGAAAGAAAGLGGAAGGAVSGAAGGAVNAAINDRPILQGALVGGVTGGIGGAGGVTKVTGSTGNTLTDSMLNKAVTGGVSSGLQGGNIVEGALGGALSAGTNAAGNTIIGALNNELGAPSAPTTNTGNTNMSDLWDIYDATGGDTSYLNYTSPDYSLAGGNADLGYLGLDTGGFTNPVDSYDANNGGIDWGNIFGFNTDYGGLDIPADPGNTTWDASNPLGINNTNGGLGFGDPSIGGSNISVPGVNAPSRSPIPGAGVGGGLTGLLAAISKVGTPALQALGLGQGGTNNGVLANLLAAYQSNKNTNSTQSMLERLMALSDPFAAQRPQYQTKLASLMNDPSTIANTPSYKFDMEQGLDAVNRNAATKGQLTSGNRLFDLTKFGQGLASKEYNNQVATLSGLAGANIAPQNIASTVATTQQGINSGSNSTLANLFNAVNSAAGANPSTIPQY